MVNEGVEELSGDCFRGITASSPEGRTFNQLWTATNVGVTDKCVKRVVHVLAEPDTPLSMDRSHVQERTLAERLISELSGTEFQPENHERLPAAVPSIYSVCLVHVGVSAGLIDDG
jgi:hypothetical protein